MRKYVHTLLFAALLCMTAPQAASAKLININFGVAAPTKQLVGESGLLVWNTLSEDPIVSNFPNHDSLSGLLDSTGAATAVSFSWPNLGYESTTGSPFTVNPSCVDCSSYEPLMKSYIFSDIGETLSMSFSGLAVGSYDMYVYSQGNTGSQILDMSVTSNGGTTLRMATNPSDETLYILSSDQNYLLFSGIVVGSDGSIDLSFHGDLAAFDDAGFGVINGIQLMPVPEPSMMLLLGVGSVIIGTGTYRRRFDDYSRKGA